MFATDEHADAPEGGGHVVQPAELRQRLQQQQPPGRHPGLVTGVHLVMAQALFSHTTVWAAGRSMYENPATLILGAGNPNI